MTIDEDKMEKTNACRILDRYNIEYELKTVDEVESDTYLHENSLIFKTLVTVSNTGEHFVFVVPIDETLDLKLAAKEVGAKKIDMILQRELLPLTGYIHGGCSPVGMKKEFPTIIDEYASVCDKICISAGSVDYRFILNPNDLFKVLKNIKYANIAK